MERMCCVWRSGTTFRSKVRSFRAAPAAAPIPQRVGACEGVTACSTCHCILEDDFFEQLEDDGDYPEEDEEDMLDQARLPGVSLARSKRHVSIKHRHLVSRRLRASDASSRSTRDSTTFDSPYRAPRATSTSTATSPSPTSDPLLEACARPTPDVVACAR